MSALPLKFIVSAAAMASGLLIAAPAMAQAGLMKDCGAEWNAYKAAGKQKPTDTWNAFLAECRVRKASATEKLDEKAAKANEKADGTASDAKAKAEARKSDAKASAKEDAEPDAAEKPTPKGKIVFPKQVDAKYASESPGRARQKSCVDQYNANKAANANGGLKWIQAGGGYWSLCTKSLKGEL